MAHISNITEGYFKNNTEIILDDEELFALRSLLIDLRKKDKLPFELIELKSNLEGF